MVVESAPMTAAITIALPMNCQAETPEARATMNSSRRESERKADIAPIRTAERQHLFGERRQPQQDKITDLADRTARPVADAPRQFEEIDHRDQRDAGQERDQHRHQKAAAEIATQQPERDHD